MQFCSHASDIRTHNSSELGPVIRCKKGYKKVPSFRLSRVTSRAVILNLQFFS